MIGQNATLQQACAFGRVPVVEVDALAETLPEASLGVVEVTFRREAARSVRQAG